ncbi:MAG: 50S ribosomal protein L31 [Micavibrio sp.]|nr:50S ribosomal protein L31 [Micavibrio sp.]|tara:strand:+ start:878 stop:1111 length:234 start_codon:yes stop_codon:yes gene_type:complete
MKKDIHPEYHFINIEMTDGTKYQTRSTWGAEGDTMRLDVDSKSHPVWTGGGTRVIEKGQMKKFQDKYAGFGLAEEDA